MDKKFCNECGQEIKSDMKFCTNCGTKIMKQTQDELEDEKWKNYKSTGDPNKYKGLGGWLILVGLGVVFGPFRILAELVKAYKPIFKDGTWDLLTNPLSEYYNPAFKNFAIFEFTVNGVIILASFYMIYLFFSKKTLFPKMFIWLQVISFVFVLLDALIASSIFPDMQAFDAETTKTLMRIFIYSAIWIPYMLVSKRVKATFVN